MPLRYHEAYSKHLKALRKEVAFLFAKLTDLAGLENVPDNAERIEELAAELYDHADSVMDHAAKITEHLAPEDTDE